MGLAHIPINAKSRQYRPRKEKVRLTNDVSANASDEIEVRAYEWPPEPLPASQEGKVEVKGCLDDHKEVCERMRQIERGDNILNEIWMFMNTLG